MKSSITEKLRVSLEQQVHITKFWNNYFGCNNDFVPNAFEHLKGVSDYRKLWGYFWYLGFLVPVFFFFSFFKNITKKPHRNNIFAHIGIIEFNELIVLKLNLFDEFKVLMKSLYVFFSSKLIPENILYFAYIYKLLRIEKQLKSLGIEEILMENHYDRFVYFIDQMGIKITIRQHGSLTQKVSGKDVTYVPNFFLLNVKKVICKFNEAHIFKLFVKNAEYEMNYSNIQFQKKNSRKTLLIIGHPTLKINFNSTFKDYEKYYKPHPTEKNKRFEAYFKYIVSLSDVPEPSLILDYGSSLGKEIRANYRDIKFLMISSDEYFNI